MRAAKGRQSNASMQASYTRSEYLILPEESPGEERRGGDNKDINSLDAMRQYTQLGAHTGWARRSLAVARAQENLIKFNALSMFKHGCLSVMIKAYFLNL